MKAITIKNPYAYLIMNGYKDVENRTWRIKYRGSILIHSAKEMAKGYDYNPKLYLGCSQYSAIEQRHKKELMSVMQNGYILGCVTLKDCVRDYESIWAEKDMWHWILEKPVLFRKPILAKGQQGLWNYKF